MDYSIVYLIVKFGVLIGESSSACVCTNLLPLPPLSSLMRFSLLRSLNPHKLAPIVASFFSEFTTIFLEERERRLIFAPPFSKNSKTQIIKSNSFTNDSTSNIHAVKNQSQWLLKRRFRKSKLMAGNFSFDGFYLTRVLRFFSFSGRNVISGDHRWHLEKSFQRSRQSIRLQTCQKSSRRNLTSIKRMSRATRPYHLVANPSKLQSDPMWRPR